MDQLEFRRDGWTIETLVNRNAIYADHDGLNRTEARVVARLLRARRVVTTDAVPRRTSPLPRLMRRSHATR